jgi:hypothetical protein
MIVVVASPVLLVAVAAVLVVVKSRRQAEAGPHCGNCGYNLTGSTSNRCPECGELFIDAGVIKQEPPRSRRTVTIALTTALLVLLAMLLVGYYAARLTFAPAPVIRKPIPAPVATTQPANQPEEQSP